MAAEDLDFGADYGFVIKGVRRYEAVSHAIYYRSTGADILVLRVLHGRIDPARHLGRPNPPATTLPYRPRSLL